MYQKDNNNEKPRKTHGFVRGLRDAISGKQLLRSWKVWCPWVGIFIALALIIVHNEYSIDHKETRNKQLQKRHDSIVVELSKVNEIIYTEDENLLREKAKQKGFVEIENNEYFIIEANKEGADHE